MEERKRGLFVLGLLVSFYVKPGDREYVAKFDGFFPKYGPLEAKYGQV